MRSVLSFLDFLLPPEGADIPASVHDFRVPALDGGVIDFSAFKGKKILIVNTASRCGHTPQYAALEALYQRFRNRLVVVGFPANNFLFQEPGSGADILAFCRDKYQITFPMAAKVSVVGRHMSPVYQWLTRKIYNGYKNSRVTWNFQKYLINEEGRLIALFPPAILPDGPEILQAIGQDL